MIINLKIFSIKEYITLFLLLFSFTVSGQFVSGIVYSGDVSNPVEYAKVVFVDAGITVLTNSKGEFRAENIIEGEHQIEVSAIGFETKQVVLNVESEIRINLVESHRYLDKVIVSNNGVLQRESVTNVESHKLSDITLIPTTSIGEAIANIPGVSQTGIGAGVRKPVVRGLSGSRVVTYVNSLRIQNQQWGGDHGLPITSLGIGSVEVIKGPASLLYGADALGGVLYFIDESYAPQNEYQVSAKSRFEHNSLGTSNELGFKWSKKALKVNAFAGYDNFADFGIPNGNQISNSRFKQSSGKLAIGYNRKKWVTNFRYNFYNGRIGLPGHTHDAVVNSASFETEKQNRKSNVPAQAIQNHFFALENNFFLNKNRFYLTVGHTINRLNEFEEKFSVPGISMDLNNSLLNFKWKHILSDNVNLIVGSQGMHQVNNNKPIAEEFLVPDATTSDLGLYSLLSVQHNKWRFQFGGRLDKRWIDAKQTEGSFSALKSNYEGYNYSIGTVRTSKTTTLRLNVSSGFRAPNTSELLSDGVHHGSFRYEIGNTNLKSEKATQIDLSAGFHFEDLEIIVNPFYNRMQNYVYLEEQGFLIDDFKVYQYVQADFAQLYGLDAGFHYHPHRAHWLHVETNITNVFAEDDNKNALPLIPQTRINTQLKFEIKSKTKFKLTDITIQNLFFLKQDRIGQFESSSPAYSLLNIGANMKLDVKNPLIISVGARNILNEEYINHLSGLKYLGINNPGINFYLSIKYQLSSKLKSN